MLRRRDDAGSGYWQEEEFIWDTSAGATARQLRSQLAVRVGCDPAHLYYAKFVPEQFTWQPIKDSAPTNPPPRGGKRVCRS